MSNEKRPNTLLNYSFSSKKVRTGTENLTSNSNTSATTAITTTMANDDSGLFLSSNPEDEDFDEVNSHIESNDLKVVNSRPNTNRNDVGYYLLNKLSIDDHLKYSLLTNHFKPDRKYSFSTLYSADHKYSRRFLIHWLNDNSFLVYLPYIEGSYCIHCVLFRNVQGQKLELFVDTPCHGYKHFTTSVTGHMHSQFHQNSTIAVDNFIRIYKRSILISFIIT
jgi:hypothetical protein